MDNRKSRYVKIGRHRINMDQVVRYCYSGIEKSLVIITSDGYTLTIDDPDGKKTELIDSLVINSTILCE